MADYITVSKDGRTQCDYDKLLDNLRHRTAMYTGSDSLYALCIYLSGFEYALYHLNVKSIGVIPDGDSEQWVRKKFNFKGSTAGWCNIITAISVGFKTSSEVKDWDSLERLPSEDHSKAKALFFQLYDEYRKVKAEMNQESI